MAKGKPFTCDNCKGTFRAAWTDEEARAENEENFGHIPESDKEELQQMCDDCYKRFEVWWAALPEEVRNGQNVQGGPKEYYFENLLICREPLC